jgi:hypothetical protein
MTYFALTTWTVLSRLSIRMRSSKCRGLLYSWVALPLGSVMHLFFRTMLIKPCCTTPVSFLDTFAFEYDLIIPNLEDQYSYLAVAMGPDAVLSSYKYCTLHLGLEETLEMEFWEDYFGSTVSVSVRELYRLLVDYFGKGPPSVDLLLDTWMDEGARCKIHSQLRWHRIHVCSQVRNAINQGVLTYTITPVGVSRLFQWSVCEFFLRSFFSCWTWPCQHTQLSRSLEVKAPFQPIRT